MRKLILTVLTIVLASTFMIAEAKQFRLTDSKAAIEIAKAVFAQEFGKEELRKIKSCEAVQKGEKWVVYLRPYKRGETPHHGGTFDVEIAVERASIVGITAEM